MHVITRVHVMTLLRTVGLMHVHRCNSAYPETKAALRLSREDVQVINIAEDAGAAGLFFQDTSPCLLNVRQAHSHALLSRHI